MVAWKSALVAAALLSASCTSIFDSYYSDSLEYLETQTDLSKITGGKTIVAVHMQVLQATPIHSGDVLAVVIDTDDGRQTVALFDNDLKKIKSYSAATLAAANGGAAPDLYPIFQDSSGLYTGQIVYPYDIITHHLLAPQQNNSLVTELTPGNGSLSQIRTGFYNDGAGNWYTVMFNQGSGVVQAAKSGPEDDVTTLSSFSAVSLPTLPGTPNLMAATSWNGKYYLLVQSNNHAYMVMSTDPDPTIMDGSGSGTSEILAANPKGGNTDLSDGWITARGAIVSSHSDNASVLHALDWLGQDKGTVRVSSSNDNGNGSSSSAAYAFHPNGQYWFAYDPANGRISKFKAWW
jgi:hypothetical protein